MKISENMRKEFVEEIEFVNTKMKDSKSISEKLYYFSALYALAQRIINFEYDPELTFIQQVLQLVYNSINSRVTAIASGQQPPIAIPKDLFVKVEETLQELASSVREEKEVYKLLERLVNLAYSTNGNGYYLYQKGKLIL